MEDKGGNLELEGGAESDISDKAGQTIERIKGKGAIRDLMQVTGVDEKRIIRMHLEQLFEELGPANNKARK